LSTLTCSVLFVLAEGLEKLWLCLGSIKTL
jgi:hypothetical protein